MNNERPLPASCPLCDNAINDFEPAGLYFAHGMKSLACQSCLDQLGDTDDEDMEEDNE